MPRSRIDKHSAGDPQRGLGPDVNEGGSKERTVVWFATFELFVVIYLQKFAVGPPKFQIGVPLIIMAAGLTFMVLTRSITFSAPRLGFYLVFVGCVLFSQLLVNDIGSVPSLLNLLLLYAFMTTSAPLSDSNYRRVLDNFIKLMVVPVVIVFVQFGIQKFTGHGDPISMDHLLPKSILLQGYEYEANFPNWNSPFQRPNGFFFLEPSFLSIFTASATIIEITFFRRPFFKISMFLATVLSSGSSGAIMLIIASPFLIARESSRVVVPFLGIGILGLCIAFLLGADLPLVSRLHELDQGGIQGQAGKEASGSVRLIIPFNRLIELLSDPSYLLTGDGSGSSGPETGSTWPILKLTHEYGLVTTISYLVLFFSGFLGRHNIPLKVATAVIFHLTGGYLMDTVTVAFFTIVFCMVEPDQSRRDYSTARTADVETLPAGKFPAPASAASMSVFATASQVK